MLSVGWSRVHVPWELCRCCFTPFQRSHGLVQHDVVCTGALCAISFCNTVVDVSFFSRAELTMAKLARATEDLRNEGRFVDYMPVKQAT